MLSRDNYVNGLADLINLMQSRIRPFMSHPNMHQNRDEFVDEVVGSTSTVQLVNRTSFY